jgi:hypothetical protein
MLTETIVRGHFKIGHYYVLHKYYENPTKYKADHIIISLKTNMFTPWYSWKIAELALNNNQSLPRTIFYRDCDMK